MRFRRRLLVLFSITVFVSVAVVTLMVSAMARRAFDRSNDERTTALVAQFRREFIRRGDELGRRTNRSAPSPLGEWICLRFCCKHGTQTARSITRKAAPQLDSQL